MFDVVVLALALSMDAFAVSIGLGTKHPRQVTRLAVLCAVYFGVFQGLMPLLGYAGGKGLLGWIGAYAPWVAFGLLLLIGVKMIYEALSEGIEEDIAQITHKVLLILAIATSVDAMAAGFTLTLLPVAPLLSCAIIGLTTLVFSYAGVFVGRRSGAWLESKAELLGGVVLILIGIKMVVI
ncbi:manganese efflux pump MntP family protein [Aestuariibacter halophilus]|uniref:Putative manganese efflux pump MntP n=1 Tax=Fluctibacter halophilus TaxID=226011 RepID=A0ABS8G372_9ALTE|nr:manganese efflux pump MntP family protein [Aestuariibacter halophilus]MCC2615032.1 manganese efflux pump MntP family protein [Aestuariibacter halophilus]